MNSEADEATEDGDGDLWESWVIMLGQGLCIMGWIGIDFSEIIFI